MRWLALMPGLNQQERLMLAVLLALGLHLVIILGVRFEPRVSPASAVTPSVHLRLLPPVRSNLPPAESRVALRVERPAEMPVPVAAVAVPEPVTVAVAATDDDSREAYLEAVAPDSIEALYEDGWRRRVEAAGNRHFPEAARCRDRTLGPVLDVFVRADGYVERINLIRSSGHPALDAAAIDMVRVAAPYPEFPPELRHRVDALHIVRQWKFEQDAGADQRTCQ
jgi:TonB family protein